MNASSVLTKYYENQPLRPPPENKPNSRPISKEPEMNVTTCPTWSYQNQPRSGSKSNSNPIKLVVCRACPERSRTGRMDPICQKPRMNVNSVLTKDYENQLLRMGGRCSTIKHQTRSNQRQFHEYGPFNGIVAIGPNHLKSQRYIQRSGRRHRWNRIQPHTGIAYPSGLFNYGFREGLANPQAAEYRPDVKSLHLTYTSTEFPERHTSGRLPGIRGNQQAPLRRGITVRKIGQFLFKVLKVQIEAQRSGIFPKQRLSQLKILTRSSLDNFQHTLLSPRTCDGQASDIPTLRSNAQQVQFNLFSTAKLSNLIESGQLVRQEDFCQPRGKLTASIQSPIITASITTKKRKVPLWKS